MAAPISTTYTKEQRQKIFDFICSQIAIDISPRVIVTDKINCPINRCTIFEWIKDDKELANRYARACDEREEFKLDLMRQIANDDTGDYIVNEQGRQVINKDNIARSKLKWEHHQWDLSKKNPKKYGSRQILENDEENPINPLTETELLARIDKLKSKL
jgi:hypothetical protein